MKRFFCYAVVFFFQITCAWAVEWTVWTPGPTGKMQEAHWDVRLDPEDNTIVAFFLKDQPSPLYTVRTKADETQVEFRSGMVRRFAPGPLIVTDLPMPLIVPPVIMKKHMACSVEYTGGMEFKTCIELTPIGSLSEAPSSSALPPGHIFMVWDSQGLKALIGSDFRAERQ